VTGRTPLLLVAQNSTLGSAARRVGRQQAEDGRNDVRLQLHIVEGEEDFDFAKKLAPTVPTSELLSVPAPSTISPSTTNTPPRC
jgi:hypothetical protein